MKERERKRDRERERERKKERERENLADTIKSTVICVLIFQNQYAFFLSMFFPQVSEQQWISKIVYY